MCLDQGEFDSVLICGSRTNKHKIYKKYESKYIGKSELGFYFKNSCVGFIQFRLRRLGVGDERKFVHGT